MGNPNYLRGRRFEYEIRKRWASPPFQALRSAGSHSPFDIVAYMPWSEYPDNDHILKEGSTLERRGGYEYRTYLTPIIGYGIQCKVRKIKGKRGIKP